MKALLFAALLFAASFAHALKPAKVPQSLMEESKGSEIVHQGLCQTKSEQALCIVGYKKETDTFWLLLFNDEGVLYKVVTVHQAVEKTRWVHPSLVT